MRSSLVVANWKMHGTKAFAQQFTATFINALKQQDVGAEIVVCPPFPYLLPIAEQLRSRLGTPVSIGAQNLSAEENGAFTGEVSAPMLLDCGARFVVVGHSERRALYAESNDLVAQKFVAAQRSGLIPILCVGESLQQREQGLTLDTVAQQLLAVVKLAGNDLAQQAVIAYEPVWAIGSGKTATPQQAQEVHQFIRKQLGEAGSQIQILYGGSVKRANAELLFAEEDIDGALVGGASLEVEEFFSICRAAGVKRSTASV